MEYDADQGWTDGLPVAAVSAVVETFGARGGPPPVVRVGGPLG